MPRFRVVDGNTVKFGPQLVRLFGIDAPEKGQIWTMGIGIRGPLAKKTSLPAPGELQASGFRQPQ